MTTWPPAPDVHRGVRLQARRREVLPVPPPQQPVVHQALGHLGGVQLAHLRLLQRQFRCRTQQLRTQNVGVARVDHHPLDRLAQQRGRVVHQVGVQRIVPGDQHHQRPWPRRPDRPACCQNEATVPGKPASTTASSPAMSTPNSSALVVARPAAGPRPAPARGRCGPRRDSRRDRTPPAPTTPGRSRPTGPARRARSTRPPGATGRMSASAHPRRSGRPSPAPPPHRRNGAPAHRSRPPDRPAAPAPTTPPSAPPANRLR